MNGQKALGIGVAAVGCLLVVFMAASLLLGFLWIKAARTEAAAQRAMAVTEDQRSIAQKLAAEERLNTVVQKLELAQQQLDETRRTWQDAVTRTDGRLTQKDRDTIDREFDTLQERFREVDEVVH
jgi:Flp pilus assembly protein TadB